MKLLSKVTPLGSKQVRKGVVSRVSCLQEACLLSSVPCKKLLALLPACSDELPLSSTLVPYFTLNNLTLRKLRRRTPAPASVPLRSPKPLFPQDLQPPSIMPCLPTLPALHTLSLAHPLCIHLYTQLRTRPTLLSSHSTFSDPQVSSRIEILLLPCPEPVTLPLAMPMTGK